MNFYDKDFEAYATVVTLREIEEELCDDWDYGDGVQYDFYVRAVISAGDYGQRLFAPIRGDYRNSIRNAISEVMNELLDDYFEYKYKELMQKKRNKK